MSERTISFWSHVKKRIIVVSTMERDVRLTFIVGAAVVAIAIFLNVLNVKGLWAVETLVGRIPALTLLFLAAGETLVLFLLFIAISRLKGRLRYVIIAGLAAAQLLTLYLNGTVLAGLVTLLPLATLALTTWLADRQAWSDRKRYNAVALLAGLTILLVPVYWIVGRPDIPITLIALQALFAMFGLFMASTDIAELVQIGGEVAGYRAFKGIRLAPARLVVALVMIGVNFAAALWFLNGVTPAAVGAAVGAGITMSLFLALFLWLLVSSARHVEAEPHIPYRLLLATAAVYFVAFQGGLLWHLLDDPAAYRAEEALRLPELGLIFLSLFFICMVAFLTAGRSNRYFAPLAFAMAVGFLWFLYYLWQGEGVVSITFAVGIGSLFMLSFGRFFRALREQYGELCALLAELNLCFAAYSVLIWQAFPKHGEAHEFGFWEASLILVALAWDIVSSGEVVTNKDSPAFPRLARVSLFFAYIVSVALFVMLCRSADLISPITGEPTVAFDSERLVGVGLILFGAPFFFFVFALRLRAALPRGRKCASG